MVIKSFYVLNFVVLVIAEQSYIELYDEPNFGGDKYVLHGSDDYLSAFNDRASSFKVRNKGFPMANL